jgi:hypothetical protein
MCGAVMEPLGEPTALPVSMFKSDAMQYSTSDSTAILDRTSAVNAHTSTRTAQGLLCWQSGWTHAAAY